MATIMGTPQIQCGSEPARESGVSGNVRLNVWTLSRAGLLPHGVVVTLEWG